MNIFLPAGYEMDTGGTIRYTGPEYTHYVVTVLTIPERLQLIRLKSFIELGDAWKKLAEM